MIIVGKKTSKKYCVYPAYGAVDLTTSNPEGMGPNPVEDRGQHQQGWLHVLTEWRQKGMRCLAPDETA